MTVSPELTSSAEGVTVYEMPSPSATNPLLPDGSASMASRAPSRTRTPRYWY
jgi:hypothetical protein